MRIDVKNMQLWLGIGLCGMIITVLWPPEPHAIISPAMVPNTVSSYVLTAINPGAHYAPTFTGNGYLGVRIPPAGQGYAEGSVPAESEVAGFYAQRPGQIQQRASIPTWSTLIFDDDGQPFSPRTGQATRWQQQLDLRDGSITTTARWIAPSGHMTDLRYVVFTDRARAHVAIVRLELTPRWAGTAVVTDLMDGTSATATVGSTKGWAVDKHQEWETVRTQGLDTVAGLASQIGLSPNIQLITDTPIGSGIDQTVGQRITFPVTGGHTYALTKYVGVMTSHETEQPGRAARQQSSSAASIGFDALRAENFSGWAALWAGRIDVLGDPRLATEINASEFYLWASTRTGVDWSISPAGLSSNGYNGHIFWDAETWMFPALLAQHPDLAIGINNYRYQRLGAAKTHAHETGFFGARFSWESALDGTEQTPPPVSVNSEGLYEQHITADIALAQWQYYLATGDRDWLIARGWPVLSQAATFWANRARPDSNGRYHLNHVTGPDEENPDVNDEAFTTAAAATTLRIATQAALVIGSPAPPSWTAIAQELSTLYDPNANIHPEFAGYQGQLIKQADVTMLQYPWQYPMPPTVAQRDINYYAPRSDPDGPSMNDAINAIDTAALGTAGCSSYVYTLRSITPFVRDVFDQFSETRTGGTLTFMTGIGGFLQEFLYGYSGLRWDREAVHLDPNATEQFHGIVLHQLAWHGRRFTVRIGATTTQVSLNSGAPLPVEVDGSTRTVTVGHPLTVSTRRPDHTSVGNLAQCQDVHSPTSKSSAGPLAAVDGNLATNWQPGQIPADLTLPLNHRQKIHKVILDWGQHWPTPPAPNLPPPPTPVQTLRATDYKLFISQDGRNWTRVTQMRDRRSGTHDELSFDPMPACFIKLRIIAATNQTPPLLEEITVPPT